MFSEELAKLRGEIKATAGPLRAKSAGVHELSERLEELTRNTSTWSGALSGGWAFPYHDRP